MVLAGYRCGGISNGLSQNNDFVLDIRYLQGAIVIAFLARSLEISVQRHCCRYDVSVLGTQPTVHLKWSISRLLARSKWHKAISH